MDATAVPPHPLYDCSDTIPCSPCSLNCPNFCDNFVKKLVSEIRKCRQLQRDFVLLTGTFSLYPSGCSAPTPPYVSPPIAEGLAPPPWVSGLVTELGLVKKCVQQNDDN